MSLESTVASQSIHPGTYEVHWENTFDTKEIVSTIEIKQTIYSSNQLKKVLKKLLKNFDKLNSEIKLIEPSYNNTEEKINRTFAIIDMNNEYEINKLISEGYSLKEIHQGKFILYKRII